jgi:hypothetical protein
MKLRTIALALALACGFAVAGDAKTNVIRPAAKSHKVKLAKRHKYKTAKRGKGRKQVAKAKHR